MSNANSSLTIRVGTVGIPGAKAQFIDLGNVIASSRRTFNAVGNIGQMIGSSFAPQVMNPVMNAIGVFREIGIVSRIAGVGLGTVGLAVAGVSAGVATGVTWLQKYEAELQAVAAQKALFAQQEEFARRDAQLLDKNSALDRLPKAEADALKKRLAEATPQGYREEKYREKVQAVDDLGFPIPGEMKEVEKTRRIPTEQLSVVEKIVTARLREVNLTDQQLAQMEALRDNTEKLHIARMEGFDKERASEVNRYQQVTKEIESRAKFAKEVDQPVLEMARMENELLHHKTMAGIEKKEWEDKVTKALELQKIQDESQLAEWEHTQRMQEENRQRKIDNIQASPFLMNSEKYSQMMGMGVGKNQLGADPNSFGEQMSVGLVKLQNTFGTFSQASANLVTNGIGSAIQGVSDGIMGVITRTKTWGEVSLQIGRQILASFIKTAVDGFAAFALAKGKELFLFLFAERSKTVASVEGSVTRSTAALSEAGAEAVSTGARSFPLNM